VSGTAGGVCLDPREWNYIVAVGDGIHQVRVRAYNIFNGCGGSLRETAIVRSAGNGARDETTRSFPTPNRLSE